MARNPHSIYQNASAQHSNTSQDIIATLLKRAATHVENAAHFLQENDQMGLAKETQLAQDALNALAANDQVIASESPELVSYLFDYTTRAMSLMTLMLAQRNPAVCAAIGQNLRQMISCWEEAQRVSHAQTSQALNDD